MFYIEIAKGKGNYKEAHKPQESRNRAWYLFFNETPIVEGESKRIRQGKDVLKREHLEFRDMRGYEGHEED